MINEVQIVIADDHAMLRHGLRQLIGTQEGMHVVGESDTGRQTLTLVRELEPDVLLLDQTLPDMSCFDILRRIRGLGGVRTILLAERLDLDEMTQALLLGACGAIEKTAGETVLFKCIRSVLGGELWFSREVTKVLLRHIDRSKELKHSPQELWDRLTRRENEVLRAVANGLPNREIASKLKISEYTVKHHLSRIFAKLRVANRVELALLASKYDL